MSVPVFFITEIQQKDNHTFTVVWNDGMCRDYRLSVLQQHCPCAGCQEKDGDKRLQAVADDVRAKRIVSVGRYALRIEYTGGCSAGIYSYDLLRVLGQLTPAFRHA